MGVPAIAMFLLHGTHEAVADQETLGQPSPLGRTFSEGDVTQARGPGRVHALGGPIDHKLFAVE